MPGRNASDRARGESAGKSAHVPGVPEYAIDVAGPIAVPCEKAGST